MIEILITHEPQDFFEDCKDVWVDRHTVSNNPKAIGVVVQNAINQGYYAIVCPGDADG